MECHVSSWSPCAPGMSHSLPGHTAATPGLSVRPRPALPAAGKQRPVSRVSRVRARLRAFRAGAVRAPDCARKAAFREPLRYVMECHVLSCSPCAPGMIYSCLGHTAAMAGSCSGSSVRPPRHRIFGRGPSSRSVLVLRSPPPGSRAQFRAFRARACLPDCARFATARLARLIARARRHPGGPATGFGTELHTRVTIAHK